MEISTKRDGKVQRTEIYEKDALVGVEEDTDDNGAVDKWETYSGGTLASVAFDTEGTDGRSNALCLPRRRHPNRNGRGVCARTTLSKNSELSIHHRDGVTRIAHFRLVAGDATRARRSDARRHRRAAT